MHLVMAGMPPRHGSCRNPAAFLSQTDTAIGPQTAELEGFGPATLGIRLTLYVGVYNPQPRAGAVAGVDHTSVMSVSSRQSLSISIIVGGRGQNTAGLRQPKIDRSQRRDRARRNPAAIPCVPQVEPCRDAAAI